MFCISIFCNWMNEWILFVHAWVRLLGSRAASKRKPSPVSEGKFTIWSYHQDRLRETSRSQRGDQHIMNATSRCSPGRCLSGWLTECAQSKCRQKIGSWSVISLPSCGYFLNFGKLRATKYVELSPKSQTNTSPSNFVLFRLHQTVGIHRATLSLMQFCWFYEFQSNFQLIRGHHSTKGEIEAWNLSPRYWSQI